MWIEIDGNKIFKHSLEDLSKMTQAAKECQMFVIDDEDEIIDDSESCQNCAFRRWGEDTIFCMRDKCVQ